MLISGQRSTDSAHFPCLYLSFKSCSTKSMRFNNEIEPFVYGEILFMGKICLWGNFVYWENLCRIPRRPPFTAYVANLPYDVDEGQVQEVFERARLKVRIRKTWIWKNERLNLDQLRSRKSDWWKTKVEDCEDMAMLTLRTETAW